MSYIVFFNGLGSQVKACYANTGHVLWMCLHTKHNMWQIMVPVMTTSQQISNLFTC